MGKFSKEAYICMVSGIWSVVVVVCSLFDVIDMRTGDNFFGVFTKVSTSMLGVVQFMVSAKLLAHSKDTDTGTGGCRARSWYYSYMLVAITMTLIFTFFYIFKERNYYHRYWGFSFFDMIVFFDIAIFVAFAIFHPPPPHAAPAVGTPNGRMNTDWIPREIMPERVIVGSGLAKEPAPNDMKIKSTNSKLPYARMENGGDSFA